MRWVEEEVVSGVGGRGGVVSRVSGRGGGSANA